MKFDFIIIGQGIAGTTLAWQLRRRGLRVLVIDRGAADGASHIAAGLITPVTGKRLAKSWRWDELYPVATAFYRSLEVETGTPFFHERPSLRLFADEAERDEFHRRESGIIAGLVRLATHIPDCFHAPLGGFELLSAARLDVPRYLAVSRQRFQADGCFLRDDVNPGEVEFITSPLVGEVGESSSRVGGRNINIMEGIPPHPSLRGDLPHKEGGQKPGGVRLPRLNVEARGVVFCRGFVPGADPWFGSIRFNAAKGEILTLRIPGVAEDRVIHRGVWLAPTGNGEHFHCGSTYKWDDLNGTPTAEGRAEIESRLRLFLKLPFEVVEHRAAARPVIDAGYPVLGRHPEQPHLAYFNGLGSKGSLLAPFFAQQLAANLMGEGEVEPPLHVRRFLL